MAVYQQLCSFDEDFYRLSRVPFILNDFDEESSLGKEYQRSKLITQYNKDLISTIPSCDCGETTKEYNLGVICKICSSQVVSILDSDVDPIVWFKKPDNVYKLINPIVLEMLSVRFTKSGFNIIQYLIDNRYAPKIKNPPSLDKINNLLTSLNTSRGLNNFVHNFFPIIDGLFSIKDYKKSKTSGYDELQTFLHDFKDYLFFDHLPIINKSIIIVEQTTALGKYIDQDVLAAIDVINSLSNINITAKDRGGIGVENKVSRAMLGLCKYYSSYVNKSLQPKTGVLRKHVYGSRANFSFRCVITSIYEPCDVNEIHVPWFVGLMAMRPHVINKLTRIGYDLNGCLNLIHSSINIYNPIIDKIFEELINETPGGKGIPCTLNRNPSLLSGSIQKKYITKFLKDPNMKVIRLPLTCIRPFNADFDGVLV